MSRSIFRNPFCETIIGVSVDLARTTDSTDEEIGRSSQSFYGEKKTHRRQMVYVFFPEKKFNGLSFVF